MSMEAIVREFLDAACDKDPDASEYQYHLLSAFRKWRGKELQPPDDEIIRALESSGIKLYQGEVEEGNKMPWLFRGVSIRPQFRTNSWKPAPKSDGRLPFDPYHDYLFKTASSPRFSRRLSFKSGFELTDLEISQDPDPWIIKAAGLLRSANAIWEFELRKMVVEDLKAAGQDSSGWLDIDLPRHRERSEVAPVLNMLGAYAVEVLLKALSIARHKCYKPIHELVPLWLHAYEKYPDIELLKFLHWLGPFAIVGGRYPVDKSPKDTYTQLSCSSWDWPAIVQVCRKIRESFTDTDLSELEFGWEVAQIPTDFEVFGSVIDFSRLGERKGTLS